MNRQAVFKYFIECILIFISVMSAFFIDSLREEKQKRQEELSLLNDIVHDLINDTTTINERIEYGILMAKESENLIKALERVDKNDTIDDYSLIHSTGLFLDKTTYEGIKNTGGFKFIADKKLVIKLSEYYNMRETFVQLYADRVQSSQNKMEDYLRAETKFIDNYYEGPLGSRVSYKIDSKSLDKIKGDQRIINLCYEKRSMIQEMILFMNSLKFMSKDLSERCSKYIESTD